MFPRVAVICDSPDEKWASMDLVADMHLRFLQEHGRSEVEPVRIQKNIQRRISRVPGLGALPAAYSADRILSRFGDYSLLLAMNRRKFDLFHVMDHSYAQVVHRLPSERTIVTCHDLDTFRSVIEPQKDPRSWAFRAMAGYILKGLCRAARVTCVSETVRREVLAHGLIPPDRVVVISNGIHPACVPTPEPEADAVADDLLGPQDSSTLEILHVGSTIPRKRIDVLLRVFSELRKAFPNARLIRAGGRFAAGQQALVDELRLGDSITVLPFLSRPVLSAVYRRAAVVLQTSDAEGFGLPVAESLACGTPVIASDLAVLREVGGTGAAYCGVGDVSHWTDMAVQLLRERALAPEHWAARRRRGMAQAAQFTWHEYAKRMLMLYREVLTA